MSSSNTKFQCEFDLLHQDSGLGFDGEKGSSSCNGACEVASGGLCSPQTVDEPLVGFRRVENEWGKRTYNETVENASCSPDDSESKRRNIFKWVEEVDEHKHEPKESDAVVSLLNLSGHGNGDLVLPAFPPPSADEGLWRHQTSSPGSEIPGESPKKELRPEIDSDQELERLFGGPDPPRSQQSATRQKTLNYLKNLEAHGLRTEHASPASHNDIKSSAAGSRADVQQESPAEGGGYDSDVESEPRTNTDFQDGDDELDEPQSGFERGEGWTVHISIVPSCKYTSRINGKTQICSRGGEIQCTSTFLPGPIPPDLDEFLRSIRASNRSAGTSKDHEEINSSEEECSRLYDVGTHTYA